MKPTNLIEPVMVTVDEACAALNVGRTHFYAMVSDGLISTVRIGPKRVRVPVDELKAVPHRLRERAANAA